MKKVSLILSAVVMSAMMLSSCGGGASTEEGASKEVTIGTQVWMTENLSVVKFRNGDLIKEAKTLEEFEEAGLSGQPAWCYYDFDFKNGNKYGRLYNWYAVSDPRGLAPDGFHIPSEAEWITLISSASNGTNDFITAANALMDTSGWSAPEWVHQDNTANNETQFNASPGGAFTFCGSGSFACFDGIGYSSNWWTSTKCEGIPASRFARFVYIDLSVGNKMGFNDRGKRSGLSVRCLRD